MRHSSTGEFEHLAEYTPNFHLENYQVITPSEPEYEPDSDTNDDTDSAAVDSDDIPTPASENPLSDTELNPNTPTDADTIVSSTLAPCPEGKYRNPETNRCKKIEEEPEQKTCAEGYYLNPSTNRCNKIKETTEPEQKICSNGYYLNPATNRCNKLPTEKELEPCKEGYERNPETNRCRKIKENTGADYPLIPTTGGVEQKNFVAIWGLIGIGALGAAYIIFQFRRDISHALKKFFARLFPKRRSK